MDDNSIQKIPVIYLPSRFVLVPGQTFPLVVNESSIVNILKYAVEHNHIFSIIPADLWYVKHALFLSVGVDFPKESLLFVGIIDIL